MSDCYSCQIYGIAYHHIPTVAIFCQVPVEITVTPGYITVKYLGTYIYLAPTCLCTSNDVYRTQILLSNADKNKYFARNKNVFREYLFELLNLDAYISTIVFASSRRIEKYIL